MLRSGFRQGTEFKLIKESLMIRPVDNKEEAIQRLKASCGKLAALGVNSVGLFGSFAKGFQKPHSDVDILVAFEPGKHSLDNFMELSFFLEELFGRRVELLTLEGLSPHIGPHILREVEHVPLTA
jgi:hypothetical protein